MNSFNKLRAILSKKQIRESAIMLIVIIIGAFIELGSVFLIYKFIGALLNSETILQGDTLGPIGALLGVKNGFDLLKLLALAIVGIYLFKLLWAIFQNGVIQRFSCINQHKLALKLFDCYMKKDYSFHRRRNSADLMRVITNDVNRFFSLLQSFIMLFSEGLTVALLGVMLFAIDPILAAGGVIFLGLLLVLINSLVSKRIHSLGAKLQIHGSAMYKSCLQALSGIKEIKAQKRERSFINTYAASSIAAANVKEQNGVWGQLPRLSIESISMMGIFSYVAFMMSRGNSIIGQLPVLATFAAAAMRLMPSVNRITSSINIIMFEKAALNTIYDTLAESGADKEADIPVFQPFVKPAPAVPLKTGVAVSNISYSFDNDDNYLFKDTSLFIPANRSVAFVGTTGSGKTTMADLILGLMKPQSGTITFDGKDIYDNSEEWANTIGYIPQSIYLCDDTIRSNVAFGYDADDIDDSIVWSCLEQAQMKEFVEGLSEGLNTITGEGGVRLSGGQRQRIGIARALYHNPQFIVLDEATSALDTETERAVIETIRSLSKTKTLLIIAHRLTTIENCDIIYRIEGGEVYIDEK